MQSDYTGPLNLGTDEMISINDLVSITSEIARKRISMHHDLSKPQGVRGRNSDNSRIRNILGWEPKITIREGLVPTFAWIKQQLNARNAKYQHSLAAE